MIKKIGISLGILTAFSFFLIANPNMQMGDGPKKLAKMAGEKSPYYRAQKEAFPKDYFLVNQNLPFLVGVALFHPNSDQLKLSKEQLKKLVEKKNTTVPAAAKVAKKIKALELQLAKSIIQEKKDPKNLYPLVDEIAKLRANLTKAHLQCISDLQKILSKEQFETLLKLATTKSKREENKKDDAKKSVEEKKAVSANSTGKDLFVKKCSSCHILGMPKDMNTMVAPALNGVMRHIKMNFPQKEKAVAFIVDYALNPDPSKAVCMPQRIKKFGLMPSQKGNVTKEELEAIANWMFENYPQKGFRGMRHKMMHGKMHN